MDECRTVFNGGNRGKYFPEPSPWKRYVTTMKLTTKTIQALQTTDRRQEIKDDGCRGLYLLVQTSGAKGWAARYFLDGRVRKATLGAFPAMGLAEARAAAGKVFEQLADDIDPREAERQAAAEAKAARTRTFGALARRFIADCAHLKSARAIASTLKPVIAEWEDRPIAGLRRRDAVALFDTIKAARGPMAATTTHTWLRRMLNWCIERDEIEASPIARMKPPAPVRARERTLSDHEVRRLWAACDERPHPFGRYMQLLLLTACRRMELATLLWSDVDVAEKTIVIPASRYKTGKAHLVPLSRQAVALLESLPRLGQYVFTGRGEQAMRGFHTRKEKIDALIDPPIDYDLHDLRRTVRTGLARLRVPESTAERCLGHTTRGIERHYNLHQYADEKRQALQAWADHISRIVEGGAAAGNVVTMLR